MTSAYQFFAIVTLPTVIASGVEPGAQMKVVDTMWLDISDEKKAQFKVAESAFNDKMNINKVNNTENNTKNNITINEAKQYAMQIAGLI